MANDSFRATKPSSIGLSAPMERIDDATIQSNREILSPKGLMRVVRSEARLQKVPAQGTQTTVSIKTTTERKTYAPFVDGKMFGLKSPDNDYCMLAKIEGRLAIRSLGKMSIDGEMLENIAEKATVSGFCATKREDDANLQLIWGSSRKEGDNFKLNLFFKSDNVENKKKGTVEWKWQLFNVTLEYCPAEGRPNDSVVAVMVSRTPIFAPLQQSFYCKHSLNVTLQNSGNSTPADVTVQFKAHMQLQPYDVEKSGAFANTFLCERSREIGILEALRSDYTIVAGCILGFVAVAMIIGYTTFRYFFTERQSYTTMD